MNEEKEYMTFEEAADFIGLKRSSIYNYVKRLSIQTHKFKYDKRTYISLGDVKRIKEIKDKPWMAGPDDNEDKAA